MLGRSGYRALPLGDFDRFQQSSFGFLGSQKGCWSPERGGVGPGAEVPQSWPSCLCHGLVSLLGFLLLLFTFPISGWFALKLASKDGALLSVGSDVQFHIRDPVLSVMTVRDLNTATRMTAQSAMTKALLKRPLREIQTEKLKISDQLLLEMNDVTRAWGLEVDRVELAVESVLQPPQDSPAGPSLDSTLQQLALHILGAGTPPPGPDTLEMVSEVEPPAPQAPQAPQAPSSSPSPKLPVAEGLLAALQPFLSEALVSQVGACYQFNIGLPGGTQSIYFLDLSTGPGKVGRGVPDGVPDVVVEITEADLRALLCRELRPLGAYMSGRLKVKGDLAVAMKLEAVLRALK
ncbi:stomatin-like protein 1 isoform X4 [Ochotona curzoniae]|uniref:stomatin-like protein 1 isoform X4 n=1 Tax=Ochotona curzoniae TaxID=130825 RepID=UPI001B3485A4|nr:stomatin-like protein 1 isoform X4 [Ochotona curzoniae]